MNYAKAFHVKPGTKLRLRDVDPDLADFDGNRDAARAETERNAARLRNLQERLYAEHERSILICLQAVDAGGKDGTIRHVLGAMNPQGCRVVSFREPSETERGHDFLWRIHSQAPARGEVVVFNRSQYEDVLVPRVHRQIPKSALADRYEQINAFEETLAAAGTHVLKFFLHISKNEQLARFKARLDDPSKHWKISESDYTEREYWDDYARAFEAMIARCNRDDAPWHVIPANHKWFRNLAVSAIVADALERLDPRSPAPRVDVEAIRSRYHQTEERTTS
jgi:PPK2 family polyphosphate:nucleotide phosphotransferase